jgi:tungstate transport system substrate-binding protein
MISGNVAINRNIYPEATKVPLTIFFDWPRRKMTLSALSQKRTFAAQKGMSALPQKRPKSDPAGIRDLKDVAKAFKAIKAKSAIFISRGDRSGTHLAELGIWHKDIGIDIEKNKGPWYKAVGQRMSGTLDLAVADNGYVLSDRGTWINLKDKGDLQILVEADKRMFNQYSIILVNSAKHPNVKPEFGQQFIDWLVSLEGQNAIANYKIKGEQLFFPNATDPGA